MYTGIVTLSLITFSVGMITSTPFGDDDPGKKYGDACELNQFCHGELVACHLGTCSCLTPEEMVYDEFSQGCKVLTGKKCEIGNREVSVNCIEGAICDLSGVCVCTHGFYATANGTCTKTKKFKESCSSDEECHGHGATSKSLVCLEGVCSCDKRGHVYDMDKRACVSTVDSECQNDDDDEECTSHAVCQQGKCVCKTGYAKSSSGKCNLGFGAECNSVAGLTCADIYFTCLNAKCGCKHPLHQVFDERTQECLSLVFGPCTFPKKDFLDSQKNNVTGIYDIQKCIKNALCVDKGFYSECECKPGYVQTKAGSCAPGYGESCEVDECDPITPLFCRNNKCDCHDLMQTWDPTIKKCVGLIGSRCTRDKPNCVEFASCVIPESDIAGQCLCDRYSVEVANRTCVYNV